MNCTVGQRFFRTDATPGQNIYGCTATNVWTLETGGGTISSLQLTDFTPSFTSSILTVQPGRVKFQNSPCVALTSAMTATIASGSGGPGVGKLYISDACAVVLEYPNSLTLTISGSGISPQAVATPGIPDTGFYLAEVTINAGAFTAVADKRSVLSATALLPGTGIGITCTTGVCLVEIDGATVPELGGSNTWTGTNDFSTAMGFTPLAGSISTAAVVSALKTRSACFNIGADNAAADLVDADIGPQGNIFKIPVAVTIIEAAVSANAATPKMPILQKNHWGGAAWSATDITSAALVTGTAGIETCAATGAACLSGVAKDGTVTIVTAGSANVLAAGDYIQTKTGSGLASSGAKRLTVCVTYTLN